MVELKEISFKITDDLYSYLSFLEKCRFIKNKEEALAKALEFYKLFAIHEWFPFVYRMGGARVLLCDTSMVIGFFHLLTNQEISTIARTTALKRKVTNPFFKNVDFSKPENWSLVLREMEIMGWGKFARIQNTIEVEHCVLPLHFLKGYFESMFRQKFTVQQTEKVNTFLFISDIEPKQ